MMMDEMSTELADTVEEQADLMNITSDSHVVDHAQIIEEFNSFFRHNPDVDNVASEHMRHGLVLPTIFAGIAIVQFVLACVVFACLIYFIIRDYMELQQRRRLYAGNVRVLPGEEQGGDNNANEDEDDDDDDRRGVGVPPAAPEGTPPSQFPNDIVRRRTPAPPSVPPPPPPPPAPSAGIPRPVAVVQVSSRPVTLTVVDSGVATAAMTASTTAATADGGTMDDSVDIGNRLQSGGAGAKPKKTRYARKHQLTYRPCTMDDSNDETSSPTIIDDTDVVSAATATDSEQQRHLADDTSAATEQSDSAANTPQLTINGAQLTAPTSRSSTADDCDSAPEAVVYVTNVVPHRTQPSAWNRPQSTADDDPVTARPTRRIGLFDQSIGLFDQSDTSAPPSFSALRSPSLNTAPNDTDHRQFLFQKPPQHQQLQKSQQRSVVMCENGVCRLRVATSIKHCYDEQTVTTSQASNEATSLLSTTIRDAKSESTASESASSTSAREATQLDVAPSLTLDLPHSVNECHLTADSSTASRPVDTIQTSFQHSCESAPAVGGMAVIPGRGVTPPLNAADDDTRSSVNKNVIVRTDESLNVDALHPPGTVDTAVSSFIASFQHPPTPSSVMEATSSHDNDKGTDQTAGPETTARHSTVAMTPVILLPTDNVQEPTVVDPAGKHTPNTTL